MKGVIMYPLALFALLILLNGYCCGAAALVEINTTRTFQCDGRLDECFIEDDFELEFLMNPYVSRVLAGVGHPTGKTSDPNHAAVTCGKPNDTPQYANCVNPNKSGGSHGSGCRNAYCNGKSG
ncbi:hypothetical protein FH972_000633 [Carpinus fangiana]|uniref:Rapid ALkalinization Factor n=1 Tax=Carpinus fangiana TaxID=176857 RepID=A0A5N6QCB6_9ROSI|nr:hypothetical protein FH972_000633 [Carpinus fangiana]